MPFWEIQILKDYIVIRDSRELLLLFYFIIVIFFIRERKYCHFNTLNLRMVYKNIY